MSRPKPCLLHFFLLLTLVCINCTEKPDVEKAEEELLQVFQTELEDLEQFENSTYVTYMDFQIKNFNKKQKLAVTLINQINKNYAALPDKHQNTYQRDWAKKFQPVIDKIYNRTRALIIRQTDNLSQETKAKIQELSDRMTALEKDAPAPKLKPTFFVIPTFPTEDPKKATP
jgi:hypothetical protein